MPKVSKNKLSPETYDKILHQLAAAFGNLKNEKEVADLVDNLLTKTERLMLAKRLAIAALLERGISYHEISRLLKVSSVTISFIRNSIMKNNNTYSELIKIINKSAIIKL